MAHSIKAALRTLRSVPPLNAAVTSMLRACFRVSGLKFPSVTNRLRRVGEVRDRLPNGRTLRLLGTENDLISNQIFWHGWSHYEPDTMPLFFRLASRSHVTIDVGANIGIFTLLAAHANPEGFVYSFEPFPPVYNRLRRNVELNQLSNVWCAAMAVGDAVGSEDFYYDTSTEIPDTSSISLESIRITTPGGNFSKTTVPTITLDSFVQEKGIGRVDLVKLDTEGTEPQVLGGMKTILERDRPVVICEVLRGYKTAGTIEEIFKSYGYRFYLLTPRGPVERANVEPQPESHWELRNYLFTHLSPDEVARL